MRLVIEPLGGRSSERRDGEDGFVGGVERRREEEGTRVASD